MSLCLCTFHKDYVFIAADSRGSYFAKGDKELEKLGLDGEKFATSDDVQKIYHIGDKVIFISGFLELMQGAIKQFQDSKNQTIEELSQIARDIYDYWKETYPDLKQNDSGFAAEFIVATVENGKCVVYSLSGVKSFSPDRIEGTNSMANCALGVKVPESLKDLRYIFDYGIQKYVKGTKIDVAQIFLDIYTKYADEEMGGYMQLYTVTPSGIHKDDKVRIPDNKDIRRLYFKNMVHCTPRNGFQIDQNVGTKENPVWDNVVYISTEGHFIIDGGWITLLTENNQNQIYLDPEKGIQISKNGEKTFYLDADGNAVFKGNINASTITGSAINGGTITGSTIIGGNISSNSTINVTTNATIGKTLIINDSLNGGIKFGTNDVLYSDPLSVVLTAAGKALNLYGSNINLNGSVHCNSLSVSNGTSGTFTSADGKTIIVNTGLITGIF